MRFYFSKKHTLLMLENVFVIQHRISGIFFLRRGCFKETGFLKKTLKKMLKKNILKTPQNERQRIYEWEEV